MSKIGNFVGADLGVKLINGKIKPKKRGVLTYIGLVIFSLLLVGFMMAFVCGLMNMNIEFTFFSGIGILSFGYLLLISPHTQNSNNYIIKVKNENSFEGFELYINKKE